LARIANEQEVLLVAADMAIQIFALESAVLRAEKVSPGASERKQELLLAAVKICAFNATVAVDTAAKKCAFYIAEGTAQTQLLGAVRRLARYDASGLLQAKRTLAKAASEEEKYLF